ncbi:MAG: flagellar hook-basal body complex protein FliE [Burkholderiaceae bacterium]|jgi:flagellar hook-basal body complex protein FliE|nr:flagellar hook-basal body complex protein FliE [Burkholderiaceae bacterium]
MDLRIPSTTSPLYGTQLPKGVGASDTSTKVAAGGFSQALQGALQSVSASQDHSGRLQREVQMENPAVSLEETMIAMQKAQIGFQATVQVRNRLVQAYTDVMNMQV